MLGNEMVRDGFVAVFCAAAISKTSCYLHCIIIGEGKLWTWLHASLRN